ncbi:hypothetical protein ACBR55_10575 [Salinicoccus roseus]|uniref:hypothetical protein n=1 Tax=Salinicoccus roseus TaxID=45670 RepID=UPI0022FFD3DA|nr:hypothetical protein [Salinicoccus roseus]
MYAGDIAPLIIGAVSLIVVYFAIDLFVWWKKRRITFHADFIAPITVFILALIFSYMIRTIQPFSFLLPLIMAIAFVPTSLLLTLIKSVIVVMVLRKKNEEDI